MNCGNVMTRVCAVSGQRLLMPAQPAFVGGREERRGEDQIGDEPRDRVERVLDVRDDQDLGADARKQGAFERRAIFRIGLNPEDPAGWFVGVVLGHGDRVRRRPDRPSRGQTRPVK